MKNLFDVERKRKAVMLSMLGCIVAALCSCYTVNSGSEFKAVNVADKGSNNGETRPDTPFQDRSKAIDFNGVRMQTNIPSVSSVTGTEEPELPLEMETDKPDDVWPEHVSLKLTGEYSERSKGSFFTPKINIYPIAGFRRVFAKSTNYIEHFDEEIKRLQDIISDQPVRIDKMPVIPFYDGTPELRTRVKYVSFKNGTGFFHLTQFNLEAYLINNRGLTYIFQGITSDKKYYILATFPVSHTSLPNSYYEKQHGDYVLPEFWHGSKNWRKHDAEYKKYLASIEAFLQAQNPDSFNPSLSAIENTISSLEIDLPESDLK